jgi:hypothetical protein
MVTPKDIRVVVISKIWAYATVMMALSVLFGGPGRNWKVIFLPATIALGASLSTIVVWGKSRDRQSDLQLPSANLEELKHRIENLEAIAASSTDPLEYALKQSNSAIEREIAD